jgi:hypothetical protein
VRVWPLGIFLIIEKTDSLNVIFLVLSITFLITIPKKLVNKKPLTNFRELNERGLE